MRDYLFFNGKPSSDFDAYITDAGTYASPKRSYDRVSVPGRNGDILFEKNSFENVEHSYPAVIVDDFKRNFDALKAFLLSSRGYIRLKDTFHPDEYYMATFNRIDSIKTTVYDKAGTFTIVFDRKPQKFLVSGERTVEMTSFPADLMNPTQFETAPLIRLYGSGTLTVNDISLTLTTSSQYVDIDCELQEALQAGENVNISLTDGVFPKLSQGKNTISFTGSKIAVTPRWYSI